MGAVPCGSRRIARRTALAVFFGASGICCISTPPAKKPAENVTVSPEKPQVDFENFEVMVEVPAQPVADQFDVRVRLINLSPSSKSIRVMSCSKWDNWATKSGRVHVLPQSCYANDLRTIELQPIGIYEDTITLKICVHDGSTKETFKIGFTSDECKRTYWSDWVTVQLKAPKPTPNP